MPFDTLTRQDAFRAVLHLLRAVQCELAAPTWPAGDRIELATQLRIELGEAIIAYGAVCSRETRERLKAVLIPSREAQEDGSTPTPSA